MTRDDIIRIAREAGAMESGDPQEWDVWLFQDPAMERFAALVTAEKDNEIERLREAYQRMKNVAAGYSNFADHRASTRKLEREFDAIEAALRQEEK